MGCATALATLDIIQTLLPRIPQKSELFKKGFSAHNPRVRGLMIGLTVGEEKCKDVFRKCANEGVLVNCAAHGNLRLVPPLVIEEDEITRVIEVVNGALD